VDIHAHVLISAAQELVAPHFTIDKEPALFFASDDSRQVSGRGVGEAMSHANVGGSPRTYELDVFPGGDREINGWPRSRFPRMHSSTRTNQRRTRGRTHKLNENPDERRLQDCFAYLGAGEGIRTLDVNLGKVDVGWRRDPTTCDYSMLGPISSSSIILASASAANFSYRPSTIAVLASRIIAA
jgi:hypothetical protein